MLGLQIFAIAYNGAKHPEFYVLLVFSIIVLVVLNVKRFRIRLFTKYLSKYFIQTTNRWESFRRIDDGWFASDFETAIFRGKPRFLGKSDTVKSTINTNISTKIDTEIHELLKESNNTSHVSSINKLSKIGATSLIIKSNLGGPGLTPIEVSKTLKNINKTSPVLASIIGILNLDSLTSFIHHFANAKQKTKYLPLITKGKMIPFLKPTSLYETLDSQISSIEGRIEKKIINKRIVLGVRISFQDVILLGTSASNCFYLNVNIKDFNNLHGTTTHLGTAICIISNEIKGLSYNKGLKAYDNYLHYYACTGNNIFVPFDHIINEKNGIGKGLEYLYKNQYIASSIWPLAVSIPTNNTATLTAWYFAHLQKQNGRQLLSFKVVLAKLNEQFGQSLKLQLMDELTLKDNLQPQMLKFTAILNKETHINQTMEHLGLLRGILGSNAHNIKTESKVRSFYKVAHLATELDGMNHEINQLPLIKKAALACHPYYYKEVELLMKPKDFDLAKFDSIIFQHIGYILHNLIKIWAYTLRTSFIGRLIFPKNKYQTMIKRMSSSFAFLADITLINWTFKLRINTSFASHLGECIQHMVTSIALHQNYLSKPTNEQNKENKELTKITLKNTLYSTQNSLKNTINLAFNRLPAVFIKLLIFPLGRPFHKITAYKPLSDNIEKICEMEQLSRNGDDNYSPFLRKIHQAKQKLQAAESAEIAVTNVTGTPVTTGNYETLINRCLAAGIVSIEQSEQLRDAYQSILEIQLTNHFGTNYKYNDKYNDKYNKKYNKTKEK
ncbi:MAG: DUF1974 domain-containing protein [Proteobacteria bacterium]|nr:DUF1974 domain-containing protein [Pseudomonadota bacterium]